MTDLREIRVWSRRVRLLAFTLQSLPQGGASYAGLRMLTQMDLRTFRRALAAAELQGVLTRAGPPGARRVIRLTPEARRLLVTLYRLPPMQATA